MNKLKRKVKFNIQPHLGEVELDLSKVTVDQIEWAFRIAVQSYCGGSHLTEMQVTTRLALIRDGVVPFRRNDRPEHRAASPLPPDFDLS